MNRFSTHTRFTAAWALGLALLALVGTTAGLPVLAAPDGAPATVVNMTDDFAFEPKQVTVDQGATVEWKNGSSETHTVTADPAQAGNPKDIQLPEGARPFHSGDVRPGKTYRYTFHTPGTYRYVCVPHEEMDMVGTVVVRPAQAAGAAGQETGAAHGKEGGAHEHEHHHKKKPATFGAALIAWLGKFHPAAVNFPIGILVAAAVAELLFLATGRPVFESTARVCVWMGALAAVVTGLLGWFMGGFSVVDPNWVKMVHRWIGTASDLCAVGVLALSEASRRPGRGATRVMYRLGLFTVAVLVLAAGYFGGALVYGLDHYAWPRRS